MKTNILFFAALLLSSFSSFAQNPITINGNVTYTSIGLQPSVLTINSGATLTLNGCFIEFYQGGELVIQIGGKLILNNTVLTCQASAFNWLGVRVMGNFNATQTPFSQGTLEMNSGTIIEKALVGISVGKFNYFNNASVFSKISNWYTDGGGIVKCNGGSIRNCRYGVIFNPYFKATTITRPNGNQSYFRGTEFYWDNNADMGLCTKGFKFIG